MSRITQNDSKFLDQLIEWGALLDPTAVADAKVASANLQITSDSCQLENELALETGGRHALRFSASAHLAIKNVSSRSIRFGEVPIAVNLPFNCDFQFLTPDEARASGRYLLTPCGRQFAFEVALNQHLQPGRSLRPGQKLEGLLLGTGTARTPLAYTVRSILPVKLVVGTETDETYGLWLELGISHHRTRSLAQNSISRRGRLLDHKDSVSV